MSDDWSVRYDFRDGPWDAKWLEGVKQARKIIDLYQPKIQQIPDPHDRAIVARQFGVLAGNFDSDVQNGRDPCRSIIAVSEIALLIRELVGE